MRSTDTSYYVVSRQTVLSSALAWQGLAYNASKREKKLLDVGGEGGVGKSQIIKSIITGMDQICRKDEVILMAPTATAAASARSLDQPAGAKTGLQISTAT